MVSTNQTYCLCEMIKLVLCDKTSMSFWIAVGFE